MNYVIHALTSQSDMNQQYLKDFLAENHVDMDQKFYTLILRAFCGGQQPQNAYFMMVSTQS